MKTVIQPFHIKSVEPIRMTTAGQRGAKMGMLESASLAVATGAGE